MNKEHLITTDKTEAKIENTEEKKTTNTITKITINKKEISTTSIQKINTTREINKDTTMYICLEKDKISTLKNKLDCLTTNRNSIKIKMNLKSKWT